MEGNKEKEYNEISSTTTIITGEMMEEKIGTTTTTTGTTTTPEIQIQLWKERNTKLEIYITKQKTRIQELEETETKLKRLLQMAKRSIDNTKQELIEKEQIMEKLRQEKSMMNLPPKGIMEETEITLEPKRILLKVIYDGIIWCLIEYSRDHEGSITSTDETECQCQCQWRKFATEKNLLDYVKNVHGEALDIPETSLSPIDAKKVKDEAKADVEKLKEEFRRYRVRAEILRKQKDAEIKKANANSVARHQEQLEGNDLQVELETCRTQLHQLSKIQNEMEDMDAMWKNKYAIIQKENEKLKAQISSPSIALQKRTTFDATSKQDTQSPNSQSQSEIFATDISKGGTGN